VLNQQTTGAARGLYILSGRGSSSEGPRDKLPHCSLVRIFGERGVHFGTFQDLFVPRNRAIHAQRQREWSLGRESIIVAGRRVRSKSPRKTCRLQVADDNFIDARFEAEKNVPQKIVRYRAGRLYFFDFERNGVRFINADPDGENRIPCTSFKTTIGMFVTGPSSSANLHLDFHGLPHRCVSTTVRRRRNNQCGA